MSVTQSEQASPSAEWGDAFAAICVTHRGRLVRWLTAIFGPHDAEDIAQEALARLYLRPGLLDDRADAWPWLSVVARNVGRDLARRNAYTTTVETEYLADLPGETRVWDQVSAQDDAERLARALRRLNPHDRALIRRRDIQGQPVAEIAEDLGTSENTVRQQLHRARRKLAASYVDLGGDRNAGLVAALGLRFRELVRRYVPAPVADAISAASATVLATLPAAAVAVAGFVLAITYGARAPQHAPVGPADAARTPFDTEPGHGLGAPAGGGTPRQGTAGRAPDRKPIVDEAHDFGPVHMRLKAERPLTGGKEALVDGIWIDNPVTGGHTGTWGDSGGFDYPKELCDVRMAVHCNEPAPS
jgi:RNA polymerase sigma factor (sigma-70 family)